MQSAKMSPEHAPTVVEPGMLRLVLTNLVTLLLAVVLIFLVVEVNVAVFFEGSLNMVVVEVVYVCRGSVKKKRSASE
jgi:hypothetical protein